MSKELKAYGQATGLNLYAVISNAAGLIWTGTGNTFAAASGITWSAAGVSCAADATLTRNYAGDFPAAITTAGIYTIEFFPRVGGSLMLTDVQTVPVATGTLNWSGLAEVVLTNASGTGTVAITHNSPTTDFMRVLLGTQPVPSATITAYLTSNIGGPLSVLGQVTTSADGRWAAPILITPPVSGTLNYSIVIAKPGMIRDSTTTITIDSSGTVTTP